MVQTWTRTELLENISRKTTGKNSMDFEAVWLVTTYHADISWHTPRRHRYLQNRGQTLTG